jgi:hypothetical protein
MFLENHGWSAAVKPAGRPSPAFEKPRCLPHILDRAARRATGRCRSDPDMILINGDHRQGRYEARMTAAAPAGQPACDVGRYPGACFPGARIGV